MTSQPRTLAIGDIHGCIFPLKVLWEVIQPQTHDLIIFMGDYVDRGPDSKGVINFILEKKKQHNIVCLIGNHEEKFCLARYGASEIETWLKYWGGQETISSYGDSIDDVPDEHWEFMRTCHPSYETDTHIFVHANLEHDVAVEKQLPFTLIHKKFGTPLPHKSSKTMICGHTAQKSHVPLNLGHAVCIDTDVGRGGWLTGLHVETGKYLQSNFAGEVREGEI